MSRAGRFLLGALVSCAAVERASPARAQADELTGVRLEWHGPASCAQAGDLLQRARRSVDPAWRASDAVTVIVNLQETAPGVLELAFEAQRSAGGARRVLTVASCEEARRTAALLIALFLDGETRQTAAAVPAPASATSHAEPKPEDQAEPASEPAAPPTPAREAEPAAPPAAPLDDERPPPVVLARPREPGASADSGGPGARDGPSIGAAGGLETAVLASAHGVFIVWAGWRWNALELDVGGSFWLPAEGTLNHVAVQVDQLGALVGACHWFSLGRWELGPSVRLLVERVDAELNSFDAGAKPWLRAAAGLRAGASIFERLSLQLAADVPFSLGRPTFITPDGASAQAPAIGLSAHAGLSWAP